MYKQFILIFGSLISLIAVLSLFLTGNSELETDLNNFSQEQIEEILEAPSDKKVTYSKTIKRPVSKSGGSNPKMQKHRYLAAAKSSDGKYAITLDSDNKTYMQNNKGYTPLYGTIEGKSFKLMVPKNVVTHFASDVKMNVTNINTGVIRSVSASFVGNMAQGSTTNTDSIDIPNGDNPGDAQHSQKNSILPPI